MTCVAYIITLFVIFESCHGLTLSARQGQTTWGYANINATRKISLTGYVHPLNGPIVNFLTPHLPQNHYEPSSTNSLTQSAAFQSITSAPIVSEDGSNALCSDELNGTDCFVSIIINGAQSLASVFKANNTVDTGLGPIATNTSHEIMFTVLSTGHPAPSMAPLTTTPIASPAACPTLQSASQTNIIVFNTSTLQASTNHSTTSKVDEILRMSKDFYTWDKIAYYILATVYTIGQAIEMLVSMWRRYRDRRARPGGDPGV